MKIIFDDADIYQLDSILAEAVEDCLQHYHRTRHEIKYEVNIVRGDEKENLFHKGKWISKGKLKNWTKSLTAELINLIKEEAVLVLIV